MDQPMEIRDPIKLPLWATIREAWEFSWDHRRMLWKWIALGVFLSGLLGLFCNLIFTETKSIQESGWTFLFWVVSVVGIILKGLVFTLIAVFCHRSILRQASTESQKIVFFFTQKEKKYFCWLLGVYVLAIGLGSLFGSTVELAISEILGVFMPIGWQGRNIIEIFMGLISDFLIYFLIGRWSLVFPAIALERPMGLDGSWRQTKGNGWRMFLLVASLPMMFKVLGSFMFYLGGVDFLLASNFILSIFMFLLTPVEVAVLSIAFRELSGWNPPAANFPIVSTSCPLTNRSEII